MFCLSSYLPDLVGASVMTANIVSLLTTFQIRLCMRDCMNCSIFQPSCQIWLVCYDSWHRLSVNHLSAEAMPDYTNFAVCVPTCLVYSQMNQSVFTSSISRLQPYLSGLVGVSVMTDSLVRLIWTVHLSVANLLSVYTASIPIEISNKIWSLKIIMKPFKFENIKLRLKSNARSFDNMRDLWSKYPFLADKAAKYKGKYDIYIISQD